MTDVNALFTGASLVSLQGSVSACLLVPAVIEYLVGHSIPSAKKWIAFVVALGLAYAVAALATGGSPFRWLIALLNGFVIFASAVGIGRIDERARSANEFRSPKQDASPRQFSLRIL